MDQFISSLPKALLAIIILVVGLFVIRLAQPPVTVCDAQMKIFRESEQKFLYPAPVVNDITKKTVVTRNLQQCRDESTPGGCFDLFQGLKKLAADLYDVPSHCADTVASEKEIQTTVWESMKLMVQIAWGEKPPVSYSLKNRWFDSSELTLFCDLRNQSKRIFGEEAYAEWQNKMLSTLPDAEKMTREQVWPLSVLSTPCDLYR